MNRAFSLVVAVPLLCAVQPSFAQSMVGYGLGVGAAGKAGSSLKRAGQAVRDGFERLPSQAERSRFVGPPVPTRGRTTEHELPIDFQQSTGVVRLYERWSGPGGDRGDELGSEETLEVAVSQVQPSVVTPPPVSAADEWGRDWLGHTPEDLRAEFGNPILSVAGGGGPEDSQITHRMPDGGKARFLVRSGVVVRVRRY